MISENIRKRIAAMNRQRLRQDSPRTGEDGGASSPGHAPASAGQAGRPDKDALHVFAGPSDARLTATLDDVAEGAEVRSDAGCFYLIERSFGDQFQVDGSTFCQRYVDAFSNLGPDRTDVPESLHVLGATGPDEVLYVDIETTGLSA